ncbi:tyrosine-type recombinase/integrase [Clavibacter capsici]|uniref:tyrosine-type recombinase/integrase n=1 Tax=Clavibacter capsici TaxID=1874630 RepID=UPI0006B157B6|nr:tyrosine-type recombinase/integrase [Clavibacter capsici]ALD13135.1 hypothetical protein AES38_09575 [Clavibacter capsici]
MADAVTRRCGCREDGKQLGARCPQLTDPKHGTWSFYLAAGTDPKTGKRVQIRKGGFKTRQAAQQARNKAAVKVDAGTYLPPTKERYAQYLERWLARHQATGEGLKETTAVNYRRYIEADIAPSALGRMKLEDIRRFHVSGLVDDLVAAGRGATTVRRIIAVVQGSLRAAYDDHLIELNPAAGVKLPRVETKDFEPWKPEQVGRFLDVAGEHRLGAMFELAMFTGLRRGELLGLRWTDVDLTQRLLVVQNNRTQAGADIVETSPKTRTGRRTVDLGDRASGALLAWKLTQRAEEDVWGDAYERSGYVFTYEDGSPLKPQYATRLFDKLRVQAGLPKMTFHGQRHEAASLMIDAGEDLAIVSKILGHSSVSVTSDIYAHMLGSASRRAVENGAALVPARRSGAHTLLHTAPAEGIEKAPALG